ncbi:MAG TPA: PRC-barrel domain-containing protein [archaeon]|jgi:sporulation protein YlmC with PRC-barrel domain|nr:PRC-barrel domain-containing protein [archaeon]
MAEKDVFEIKNQSKPLEKTVEVSRILGKTVISKDGRKLGTIQAIHIHPTNLTVEGIRVKRGMFETDDYIGREYIQSLTQSGAVLKILPVKEMMGLDVFDMNGKRIGKIKAISRSKKTNVIVSFTVERGFRKEDAEFSGKDIKEVGKGVILRVPFKD